MLHDKFKKMLEKKRDLSDVEKEAKMDVMKDMRNVAGEAMRSKLDGVKKVSIMSDSNEGIKKGLEKAEEMIEPSEEMESEEDMESSEDSDLKEELKMALEDMPEEKLMMIKEMLKEHMSDGGKVEEKSPVDPDKFKKFQQGMKNVK